MPNPHDPRRDFSGQPDRPEEPADEATFKLLGPHAGEAGADDGFGSGFGGHDGGYDGRYDAGSGGGYDRGPGGGYDSGEPTRATVLDPDSWSSEVPPAVPPPGMFLPRRPDPDATYAVPIPAQPSGGLRRFGPGVPGPDASAGTAHTAAVWHGTLRPGDPVAPAAPAKRRRRALRGWLLALVVLLGVLAYLLWQRLPGSVTVEGVTVRNATAVQGCHSTAKVTGTLRTSGGPGTVHYRWRRSDGTVSDELTQHIAKGHRTTDVVLLWTFDGPGTLRATATLDILSPQSRTAAATFTYRCG